MPTAKTSVLPDGTLAGSFDRDDVVLGCLLHGLLGIVPFVQLLSPLATGLLVGYRSDAPQAGTAAAGMGCGAGLLVVFPVFAFDVVVTPSGSSPILLFGGMLAVTAVFGPIGGFVGGFVAAEVVSS